MRVKMRTSIAGVSWSARAGQEIDLPEAKAASLIKRGFAEAVEVAIMPETENMALITKPIKRKRRETQNG